MIDEECGHDCGTVQNMYLKVSLIVENIGKPNLCAILPFVRRAIDPCYPDSMVMDK